MVRFTITLVLSVALVLWNLPEFETWGRNDHRDKALTRSVSEVLAKADAKAVSHANSEAEPRRRR
jgi:hypothetical protein